MNNKTNFGVFGIVSAMLVGLTVYSCGNDDLYNEGKAEQIVNEQYATNFERTFGKVGSNVDWGFSSKSFNTRAITRAVGDYPSKGNLQPTITFPSDCDASKFLADVPEGVNKFPDSGEASALAGPYYIDDTTPYVHMYAGAGVIYVKGTVDLSDKYFEVSPNTEIYLVKGSTLKLRTDDASTNLKVIFYIESTARLETEGLLKMNASSKVYNHGTISAGEFEVNTESFLYNVGKLETTGSVNVESNNSRIVNNGTINSASVQVKAGALQNNAEWTVSGTTVVTSNNSGWVNNGHWTTQYYAYTGGSENVINNCLLEVAEDFDMNISSEVGAFKIATGGGVLTKNFYGGRDKSTNAISGPFKIVMSQDAVFKVAETATLEGGRGEGFGFFGPSEGGYAIFEAKNIVRNSTLEGTWGAVTYGGHLYVSAETHFAQGDDGYAPHKIIFEQNGFSVDNNIYAAGFKTGKPDITIEETECSPGFEGGELFYRVIGEDLSAAEAGDFDFNDVVFDIVEVKDGKTTLKLICAGGVLPIRVRGENQAEGVEIHSVFGEAPNEQDLYKMYNTGAGPTVPEATFTVEGEYTTPEQIKNIIIEVKKNGIWMPLPANQGQAACKILVDSSFKPVKEKRNIADEHQRFTNYVQGSFQDDFWWK